MIAGQSHLGDFYFIRPDDVPAGSYGTDFIYNTSVLCKFDPNTFGDFDPDDETKTIPINVSYLTPSSNLGINQLKIPQRITITGTSSTFWGDRANNLRIMAISDYQENPTYWYQYVSPTGVERVMKRMGIEKTRELKSLNFKEKKEFKKLYLTESSIISSVDISLLCKPANRIGLYMHMDILEANIIIYGYEIYLKVMNKV